MRGAYKRVVQEIESSYADEPGSGVRPRHEEITRGRWSKSDYQDGLELGILVAIAVGSVLGASISIASFYGGWQ